MNAFAIAGLFFVSIPSIIVGPFILLKGRKKVHLLWAAFLSAVALWGFGMFKIGTATNNVDSLFWWRIAEIGVIFIPVFLVHFVISFLELKRRIFLILFYIATAVFLFCNIFTDYFIKNLYFAFNQFYYISATPLYTVFICVFVASVIYVLVELTRAYKKSTSVVRYQIKYLMLAFFIGFSGGITSYPPVYKLNVYPVWNATILISVILVAYAILRYRFMDLRVVVRKTVIYFISAAFVYGIFYLVAGIYNQFFGGIYTKNAYISGLVIAPLFVLIFVWLNERIKFIANKYFFFSLYSYQKTINDLSQRLNYLTNLDEIVELVVDTVKKAMQLDRAGILLIENEEGKTDYKIAKVIGFNEKNGISLVQDNFLTKHLRKTQRPLVKDELMVIAKNLNDPIERQKIFQLSENMNRIEASLCLPLMSSKRLIGIVVLGSKVSGDAYTNEDLELLNTLSFQAGVAIDNARLYKEIRALNENLQQKVDEQTKEIRQQKEKVEKAYEIEKHAHEELKELDEAKTNFMLITQHHLRTPLSVNKGFLDLLLSGKYGRIPKKIKGAILELSASTEKEIETVNELLDVSSYQLGHGYALMKPGVPVKNILAALINDLKPLAENNKIYLNFESRGSIPNIVADERQLKMALQNIIDNAIKYTKKGGVFVKIEAGADKIKILVKDTGIGMDKAHKKRLFEKPFQRSKEAWTENAVGKGIGLYLSAQIIKTHGGNIWAESEGPGKGSAFYIELPLALP